MFVKSFNDEKYSEKQKKKKKKSQFSKKEEFLSISATFIWKKSLQGKKRNIFKDVEGGRKGRTSGCDP